MDEKLSLENIMNLHMEIACQRKQIHRHSFR
jgi:hypothetical protein